MADTPRFWNLIAKRYSRQKIGDPIAYEEKLKRTRALFKPDMRILELGCGTGGTARLHSKHVAQVHAVDFSHSMVEIARQRSANEGVTNVTYEVASVDDLQIEQPFDVVMAMSLLHLLPNWRAVLANIHTYVRPGGYFVSSTVVLESAPLFLRILLKILRPFGLLPPVQAIPAQVLRDELEMAGFHIVDFWQPKADSAFVIAQRPA